MTASIARKSVTVAEYSLPSGERRQEWKRALNGGRGRKMEMGSGRRVVRFIRRRTR